MTYLKETLKLHVRWLNNEVGGVRADLSGADFSGADFSGAYLSGADLSGAYLRGANLSRAYLRGADLRGADLRGAYLNKAYLSEAYLSGANLTNTVLDPTNRIPDATEDLIAAGLTIKDGMVYGFRTKKSKFCGNITYTTGRYEAPFFSTCKETACHPGIYFASKEWLKKEYGHDTKLVKTAAWVSCTLAAGAKFRTKELWIL